MHMDKLIQLFNKCPCFCKIYIPSNQMISEILLMSHVHSLHSSEVFIICYSVIVVGVLCQCRYWWGERLFLLNKLSIIFIICRWNCWDCCCGAISFYINLSSSGSMYLCLALSYASTSCCTALFINALNWLVHVKMISLQHWIKWSRYGLFEVPALSISTNCWVNKALSYYLLLIYPQYLLKC